MSKNASNSQEAPDPAAEQTESFDFSKEEEVVLKMWTEIDAFKTQLKLSENRKKYTFYDGPPFATGLPHYGHILAGTIKDTVTRWATQTGHYVERRFGWDCHGLPVEFEIDQTLGIKGPQDVLNMGVDNYNNECRKIVMRLVAFVHFLIPYRLESSLFIELFCSTLRLFTFFELLI
jgi:isoleucyl-tRNA synthetase